MKERKRVSPDDVRNNARQSGAGGSSVLGLFTLPEGVGVWEPEKAGKYALDFLPYEIKIDNHPDKQDAGVLWWKFPFQIHKSVGVNKEPVICPRTFGKPCPICQEKDRLSAEYEKNKDLIRAIKPQRWWAYKIRSLKDPEKIDVFAISEGKFHDYQGGGLNYEIETGDEKNLAFFDLVKGRGRTVTVRFAEETYEGRNFFKASRFDFAPREDTPAAEVDDVIDGLCLDDIFGNVLPYEKIAAMFADTPNGAAADAEGGKSTGKAEPRKRNAPEPEEAEEPNESEDPAFKVGDRVQADEGGDSGTVTRVKGTLVKWKTDGGKDMSSEADDIHPFKGKSPSLDGGKGKKQKWKIGDRVQFSNEGKPFVGKIIEIDGQDATVENDDGDEVDAPLSTLQAPAEAEEPEDAPAKPPAKTGGKKTAAKEPEPAPKKTFAVGEYVEDDDGIVGKVTKVKGKEVTYKSAEGTVMVEDAADLKLAAAPGDDADDDSDDGFAAPLKEGDEVTWDGGMEEGTVVKIKGDKAKVKNDDGGVMVTLALSALAKK